MAQIPDDLFEFNRIGEAPGSSRYRGRLGTVAQRIGEGLRIEEVPRPVLVAIAVLMLVACVLGIAAVRSCSHDELVFARVSAVGSDVTGGTSAASTKEASDAPGEPARIGVYVAGCVVSPGVYYLDEGSRVCDALAAAGGTTADADLYSLNLASVLSDSQKVYVPQEGEAGADGAGYDNVTESSGLINLNTAGVEELQGLVGIGPSLAAAIVEDRSARGPFAEVGDLTRVPGIGEKTLSRFA